MNFLQFFVWGSWLISLGGYMGRELHFEGGQIGAIFATMGIASLVMPGIIGIIADKWFNAERLYGLCHIAGAACLFYASTVTNYDQMYWAMLLNLLVYMPTLSLANTVSYNALEQYKCDLIKDFPPIRVWGTIGFICAMWAVDLTGFKNSSAQLYVGGASALLLGLYSFTLPACKPAKTEKKTLLSSFGLDAFVLFKRKKMAIFFLFSMLLGAALQITNTYGDLFLGSFASIPEFADSFGVKHSVILLSISQMLKKSNAIPYTIMERISIHRPEPGSPKPNSPNRNTQANILISITCLMPKCLRKNGIARINNVSDI